jgi:hypothetical protein
MTILIPQMGLVTYMHWLASLRLTLHPVGVKFDGEGIQHAVWQLGV